MDLEGWIWSLGLRREESSWGSDEERKIDVLLFGNSKKTLTRDIGFQVRTIRKDIRVNPKFPDSNPEYPGKSEISGFKPGVSGFPWLQNLKSSFESICDSTCNRENWITS